MSRFENYTLSSTRDLLYRVYGWMGAGLTLSGATAWAVSQSPTILKFLFTNPFILLIIFAAEMAMIFMIQSAVNKMNSFQAATSFTAFSILNGLTLSSIFIIYTLTSIASTFAIAATMFATMAIYGYFTKSDLSSMRSYFMMGIFGLIVALLVNMLLQSSQFNFIISIAGVIIFTLMAAYDMQKIKQIAQQMSGTGASLDAIAISCALSLYLDFINLFLYLLRLFGKRRD